MKSHGNTGEASLPPTDGVGESSNNGATRRDFFKAAAVVAGGTAAVGAGLAAQSIEVGAQTAGPQKKFKVVDFRCKPPLKPYSGLYQLRINGISKRPNTLANSATSNPLPPSITMVGQAGAMEEWWKEIDAAGVDVVVANGRYAAGDPSWSMDSQNLAQLQNQYKSRFFGLAALNLDQPMEKTISELEAAIKTLGLRGANIEPGYRTKNGGATTIDDADFYPIFETMSGFDLPLMVQTGAFSGLESFGPNNDMALFDTVKVKFPKLKIVLSHGGYPSIQETLGLALKHPNVFICPDVYTFWPGGQLYQQNIGLLPDQFLCGSAFPFGNVGTTLEQTLKLPLSETAMKKYLYE